MARRICEITVTLDFIFRLVHCSSEDVSFNSICLKVLESIKQFYLLMWFKKTRLETPFKGDNVKALVNVKICSISCKSITFSSAIFDYSLSDTCSSC